MTWSPGLPVVQVALVVSEVSGCTAIFAPSTYHEALHGAAARLRPFGFGMLVKLSGAGRQTVEPGGGLTISIGGVVPLPGVVALVLVVLVVVVVAP
jgi:hypothetical protein